MPLKKIVVFISGGGTNLQALIDNIHGKYGDIVLVVSNKFHAYGLVRAENAHIPTLLLDNKNNEHNLVETLISDEIDLIVLAGYLNIITPELVKTFRNKIINIHPSLIPAFCGKNYYGIRVHEKVYEYGVKITGATVHFVDEGTDTGPIIMQRSIDIDAEDNPGSIQQKVLNIEHVLLCECVRLFCENKITIEGRRVKIIS